MSQEVQMTATYLVGGEIRVATSSWTAVAPGGVERITQVREAVFSRDGTYLSMVQPCGPDETQLLIIRASAVVDLTISTRTIGEAP